MFKGLNDWALKAMKTSECVFACVPFMDSLRWNENVCILYTHYQNYYYFYFYGDVNDKMDMSEHEDKRINYNEK